MSEYYSSHSVQVKMGGAINKVLSCLAETKKAHYPERMVNWYEEINIIGTFNRKQVLSVLRD